MRKLYSIKRLTVGALFATFLSIFSTQSLNAQPHGAAQLPPIEPRVDQLGQMEGLQEPEKVALFVTWFLSLLSVVAVAVALAGHMSMPTKKRTPKV